MPMMGKFSALKVFTQACYGDDTGLEDFSRKDLYKTGQKSRRQQSLGQGNFIKRHLQGGKILHLPSLRSGKSSVATIDRF